MRDETNRPLDHLVCLVARQTQRRARLVDEDDAEEDDFDDDERRERDAAPLQRQDFPDSFPREFPIR